MTLKVIAQTNAIYMIFDTDHEGDMAIGSLIYNSETGESSNGPYPMYTFKWFPWRDPDANTEAQQDLIVAAALAVPHRKSWPTLNEGLTFTPVPTGGTK